MFLCIFSDDNDSLLNGVGISSSADVYQKLKVGHFKFHHRLFNDLCLCVIVKNFPLL